MDKNYNVVGYVKLAKLWERSENSAIEYHHNYYQNKFANYSNYNLHDVYIDITGKKETYKRMEMVRLLKDCQFGYVDIIFTQTKGYFLCSFLLCQTGIALVCDYGFPYLFPGKAKSHHALSTVR